MSISELPIYPQPLSRKWLKFPEPSYQLVHIAYIIEKSNEHKEMKASANVKHQLTAYCMWKYQSAQEAL